MIHMRHLLAGALAFATIGLVAGNSRAASPFNAGVATFEQSNPGGTWSAALAIDGNTNGVFNGTAANGWAIAQLNGTTSAETAYFRLSNPIQLTAQNPLVEVNLIQMFDPFQQSIIVSTQFHTIGRFRISATTANLSSFNLANAAAASWTSLAPTSFGITVPSGPVPTYSVDGTNAILINGPGPALATYNFRASPGLIAITGFRLEVLTDPSLPTGGPGFQPVNGNFVLNEINASVVVPVPAAAWTGMVVLAGLGAANVLKKKFASRRQAV